MPGAKETAEMKILTARHDRYERPGWAVFHSFPDDGQRGKVIQALLPKVSIDIRAKADLPHARSLNLTLGDGRRVVLLLDQGFGAWRAEGEMRHDFKGDPPAQARALRAASFRVVVEANGEVPIILEDGAG